MEDVERTYDAIMSILSPDPAGNSRLCLMQCTSGYPCSFDEMNLSVITTYRECFPDTVIGLSAHDSGIAMGLVGYVLGARVIEKHFTLNRAMKGTDHAFSLERPGLRKLVRDVRRARVAMGDGIKKPYASEAAALYKMGKKLVVAGDVPAGHVLLREDIAIKSPNDGLPPYQLASILGKTTLRALTEDEAVSLADLSDA